MVTVRSSFSSVHLLGPAFAALLALVGCGGAPVPVERVASSEAAIRAAREVGASKDPKAALHLRYAEEAFGQAKEIVKNGGDNRRADMLLRRAEADAEYALALAKEKQTQEEAKALLEQLQTVKKKNL